jgi:hypothetical protein
LKVKAFVLAMAVSLAFASSARAQFIVDPYLQNPTVDEMSLIWFTQTNTPGTLTVDLPSGPQVFNSAPVFTPKLGYHALEVPLLPGGIDPGAPYRHRVRVSGLTAGTAYDYTVDQGAASFSRQFRTAPNSNSSVRFMIFGDSETEPESTNKFTTWPEAGPLGNKSRVYVADQTEGYKQNINVMKSRNPDFIGIAGDLVQSGGEQRDWDEFWRHNAGSINDLATTTPILASPGNHENYGGPGGFGGYGTTDAVRSRDKFQAYFETPDNGTGTAAFEDRFFRNDYGPITYITIDATDGLPNFSNKDTNFFIDPAAGFPDFNSGSAQFTWLQTQLADAQANSQFTFVQFHHAPYSVGPHGLPAGSGAGFDTQSGVPVRALSALFETYGVDAVFSGHDEMYERSLVNGIQYYDIGIGGDGLRGPSTGPDGSTGEPTTNPFQQFLAHNDAPEVWSGDQLISGGKHYGHLEVNVFIDTDGFWKTELLPVYIFPLMDVNGDIIGWERRVYNDVVLLTGALAVPEPSTMFLGDRK